MSIYTSLLTAGANSHQETSENANAVATDLITPGVIGAITNTAGVAPSTGAFAANAQGSPNMTVAVSAGNAYVTATPTSQNSQTLRVRNTASANVTISANASGSTKYDWVYLSIDAAKAAAPAVNADDVTTLVTSRSSSSTSDNGTPPAFGYCIAVVTVANGASSITNGNIADKRSNGILSSALLNNPYKFNAYWNTASPSTAVTTWTRTPMTVKNYDTGSNLDISTNPGRFTAPVSGFYHFDGHFQTLVISVSIRLITALYKNGVEYAFGGDITQASNYIGTGVSETIQLAAGDYVEFMYYCSIAQAVDTAANRTRFSGHLVSAA